MQIYKLVPKQKWSDQFYFTYNSEQNVDIIIIILQKGMSRRIFKMLVPIQLQKGFRQDTTNIHKYINKVPCDAIEFNKPSEAAAFIQEEMAEYPISQGVQSKPKRQEYLKSQVKRSFLKDREARLLKLSLKLQKNLSFLQLQEIQDLLPQLSSAEVKKHFRFLNILSNKLVYQIQSSTPQTHVLKTAKILIEQINKILSTKTKQLH